MRVQVRNNNISAAIGILNKKLQEDNLFKQLKERRFFKSKGEKRREAKKLAIERHKKDVTKKLKQFEKQEKQMFSKKKNRKSKHQK